ncbi:hypothetical protein QGX11_gp099 [Pseudomonas phage PPSC2]|uniref:Uncharacterized protein n=1 Tax=Pseudomonas phage PPSC2 TaxID=2041350 RepID=A0A2R2YB18_9CAUD|nr:hypothetical protein QGX11_gp099 [Pseudomonas phage PPSC2]ATN92862.1 hypothetical protein PPSC2_99 [Pseudomonas phage PPSC2]
MGEVEQVKRLAVKINDWLVIAGFIVIVVAGSLLAVGMLATETPLLSFLTVVGFALIALVLWAIGSGLWCVLSGIHYELKKLNEKA